MNKKIFSRIAMERGYDKSTAVQTKRKNRAIEEDSDELTQMRDVVVTIGCMSEHLLVKYMCS